GVARARLGEVRANGGKIRCRGEGEARPRGRRRHLDHGADDAGGRARHDDHRRSERTSGGRGRRRAGSAGERAVHGRGIGPIGAPPAQATSFLNTLAAGRKSATKFAYSRALSASSSMRSKNEGWTVTKAAAPSARCKVWSFLFEIVVLFAAIALLP